MLEPPPPEPPLAAPVAADRYALTHPMGKRAVIALALGQALLLLFFHEGVERGWDWATEALPATLYLTAVLSGPSAAQLLVGGPRRRRTWLYAAGLTGGLFLMALYAGSLCDADRAVACEPVLVPYALTAGAAWFVALGFLHADLVGRRNRYAALHEAVWHHALSLAVAALTAGLTWLLLAIWAELFEALGVDFFADVFYDRRFAYAATGFAVGLGLVIGRGHAGAALAARRLLLLVVRLLLPLGALIALVFLLALPLVGLQPLWDTGHAASLLLALLAVLLLFLAVVYETGDEAPYPRPVRLLVDAALAALPVHAALAAYAVALRVGQYGWTTDRFWAMALALLLGAYALATAVVVLRRRSPWLRGLRRVNVYGAMVLLAALVLVNTPLLHPLRLVVPSQVARLRAASEADASDGRGAKTSDLEYLRFSAGLPGYEALRRLQAEDAFADRPRLAARLDTVLARTSRYGQGPVEDATPEALRTALDVVPDTAAVPDALLQVLADDNRATPCLRTVTPCILLRADVYRTAPDEYLLFRPATPRSVEASRVLAWVYRATDDGWEHLESGDRFSLSDRPGLLDALRAGRVRVVPSPWRSLEVGGEGLDAPSSGSMEE